MPEIRFCRLCGTATEQRIPPLEDRPRAVCPNCGYVDYVNPINVVGTVPVWWGNGARHGAEGGEQTPLILLCRRAIEPRRGFWTLPAGFLETGETLAEGAVRETWEEAGARIDLEGLFSVLDVVHANQVHVFFRARLRDLDLDPGVETLENRLFPVAELPWEDLAFRTVRRTLQAWVEDRAGGTFGLHTGRVDRPALPDR